MVRTIRKNSSLVQRQSKLKEIFLLTVEEFNQAIQDSEEFQIIENLSRITRDQMMQNLFERSSQDTYLDTINDSVEMQYLIKLSTVLQQTISEIVEEYIIHNEVPSSEQMQKYLQELDTQRDNLYNRHYKEEITDPFFGIEQPFQKSEVTEMLEKRAKEMALKTEEILQGDINP